MKRLILIVATLAVALFTLVAVSSSAFAAPAGYSGYPTFSIQAVVRDQSVTIKTNNFPANDTFTVTMGKFGTLGIGGTVVTTTNSGQGGIFTVTYTIPAGLQGQAKIAIRLQSPTTGYYAYNWFYNNTTAHATVQVTNTPGPSPTPKPTSTPTATATPGPSPTPTVVYVGYPTFSIQSVVRDQSVTIRTNNLRPNDTFTVTMAPYGTLGIGGTVVATTSSGAGGTQTLTYDIPAGLKGSYRIAIRMYSATSGYYAYNWFYNNNAP